MLMKPSLVEIRLNMSGTADCQAELTIDYDPLKEIKAFDDTKAGVKGLVDAGIVEMPRFFIRPPHELAEELKLGKSTLQVPVIDISGIEIQDRRKKIVDEIREASEKWGFFQLINHGVPPSVLEGMIDGIREFHEQDAEVKKEYYSFDIGRNIRYHSNPHMYQTKNAQWRDTLNISTLASSHIEPEEIPAICREFYTSRCFSFSTDHNCFDMVDQNILNLFELTSVEYINHVMKLGEIILGLLSEALGLKPDHLKATECDKGQVFVCHYNPACPQPELTLGAAKHTDPAFLAFLLQDQISGLQVVHDNQWVNVEPIEHGLVVSIADFLQILSNNKFVSADYRVVANKIGPRMSVASFFTGVFEPPKMYGPIKEFISEETPPLYKEFLVSDYITKFFSKPLDKSGLDLFRL